MSRKQHQAGMAVFTDWPVCTFGRRPRAQSEDIGLAPDHPSKFSPNPKVSLVSGKNSLDI